LINKIKSSFVLFTILLGLLSSCSDELNFDQFDDLDVTPTFESSILFIEIEESIINFSQVIAGSIVQDIDFDAFSQDLFAKRVISGVVTYEIENTTSKDITISFGFLDENGVLTDTETFNVGKAPPLVSLKREVVYGPGGKSLDIIKNTVKIRLSATNTSGDYVSVNQPDSKVVLKSKGEFKVRLK